MAAAMQPSSEREYLLVMDKQMEVLTQTVTMLSTSQERYGSEIGKLQDRVDSLAARVQFLIGVLLFLVTPAYAGAIYYLVAHGGFH